MHLTHLGLPVADEQRSALFYQAYFGFDPETAQRYGDGRLIIRNADGFDLALHPVASAGAPPGFLHFGFRLARPGEVHALMAHMEGEGVTIAERDEEPGYVAFKCLDPDGYRIEVYCEPGETTDAAARC